MRVRVGIKLGVVLAMLGAACAHSSTVTPTTAPTTSAAPPVTVTPSVSGVSQTLSYGYYDAHLDSFASTDVSSRTQAAATHVNYSPGMAKLAAKTYPSIYMVQGTAAPGQLMVFGSEPGESDYSPLWRETDVTWASGATPVVLKGDDQINSLAAKGKLTVKHTSTILNCPIVSVNVPASAVSSGATVASNVVAGYYDAHQDTYISTDVSTKSQASAMHINYAPGLTLVPAGVFPSIYMVEGPAAPNQITVFGSEPGENDYSPIWDEVIVKWKSGVTPVLLTSDNQIGQLATKGQLTAATTSTVLNCPILSVGG